MNEKTSTHFKNRAVQLADSLLSGMTPQPKTWSTAVKSRPVW
jgi:hypothetical protein